MKKILVLMMMLLAMQAVSYSQCVQEGKAPGCNREQFQERTVDKRNNLAKELNLTPNQKADMERINIKYQKQLIPIEAKIRESRLELHEVFLGKDIDEQKAMEIVTEIGKNETVIKQKQLNQMFETLKLLTDEQKQKLREAKAPFFFFGFDKNHRGGQHKAFNKCSK